MMPKLRLTPLDSWIAAKTASSALWLERQQIEGYQLKRLNETIWMARNLSPFYQRHLAGSRTKNLSDLKELTDYPFISAEHIAEQAIQMLCVSQSEISRVVTLDTSGTTGNPKRLYFTKEDQELTIDFFGCAMSTLVGPGDKTLILLPCERAGGVGDLLAKALPRIGVQPVPYGLVGNVAEAVHAMCNAKATSLVGVPSQVLAIARYWEHSGKSAWAPSCALLSTDYVPQAIVRELKRIWNCDVYDHYGMTEMGLGGGIECAALHGYHMREADLFVEIINPQTLQPAADGEYGEVVFTTLTRRGMPLIRYRTGDISRVIPEPCPCGSTLKRIEKIRSRRAGQVFLEGGQPITMADFDEVLFALPGITNFTVHISFEKTTKLQVFAFVLPESLVLDKAIILSALRQLPGIARLEAAGSLELNVEVIRHFAPPSGKRAIKVVYRTREDESNGQGQ